MIFRTLILFLFFNLNLFSQECEYIITETITVSIHPAFIDAMDEFVEGCKYYNIDLNKLRPLKTIYMYPLGGPWGVSFPYTRDIFINSEIPYYLPTFVKVIIFHEIAHILDVNNHDPFGPYILRSGAIIRTEEVIRNWEFYKIQYFLHLKANLN